MTLFYIIRHGETDFNRSGRYQGQSDVPMNPEGRRQCRALADRMARAELDIIYSSDLARAQECARIIACGRTVALDPRLREIDVGRVVGLDAQEIAEREPAFWAAFQQERDRTPFPGGESALDVRRRALEAVSAIHERYPDGRVAVVTHGGLITMLVAEVLSLPLSQRRRLVPENCGLTLLQWSRDRQRLRSFNDTGHLAEAPCDLRTEA